MFYGMIIISGNLSRENLLFILDLNFCFMQNTATSWLFVVMSHYHEDEPRKTRAAYKFVVSFPMIFVLLNRTVFLYLYSEEASLPISRADRFFFGGHSQTRSKIYDI
jgi:hypothetical protein